MSALIIKLLSFSSFIIFQHVFVSCRSGYINSVTLNAKFHCDTSKMKMYKASSELQCVHKCAAFGNCHLINFRVDGNKEKNCEVFQLPDNHKSCSTQKGKVSWKALVFQVKLSYLCIYQYIVMGSQVDSAKGKCNFDNKSKEKGSYL